MPMANGGAQPHGRSGQMQLPRRTLDWVVEGARRAAPARSCSTCMAATVRDALRHRAAARCARSGECRWWHRAHAGAAAFRRRLLPRCRRGRRVLAVSAVPFGAVAIPTMCGQWHRGAPWLISGWRRLWPGESRRPAAGHRAGRGSSLRACRCWATCRANRSRANAGERQGHLLRSRRLWVKRNHGQHFAVGFAGSRLRPRQPGWCWRNRMTPATTGLRAVSRRRLAMWSPSWMRVIAQRKVDTSESSYTRKPFDAGR